MIKYKLLAVSKYSTRKDSEIGVNIGDYIQALASSQFYPHIDGFVDRDEDLKDYDGEPAKIIANGWYMHNPKQWPPSPKILPLFVAFHINSVAKKELLSFESIDYLKQFSPIGCRDMNTMEMLQESGVDAYFSGCMTLTLGTKYHSDEKDDKTYIVDPIYDGELTSSDVIQALKTIIAHPVRIWKLNFKKKLDLQHGRNIVKNILKIAMYYEEYTKVFSPDLIMNSEYISQDTTEFRDAFVDDTARLAEAERLIKLYARAKLVITSRIHCALPCLGLETPVVYLEKANDSETSKCRLKGLTDLFNIVEVKAGKLFPKFSTALPISKSNHPKNKSEWKQYAEKLKSACIHFMAD